MYVGLLATAILLFGASRLAKTLNERNAERYYKDHTEAARIFIQKLISGSNEPTDSMQDGDDYVLPDNWHWYRYDSSGITDWSSNEWLPDSNCTKTEAPLVYRHTGGWDLVINQKAQKILMTYPLVRHAQGSFKAQNDILPLKGVGFELTGDSTDYLVYPGVYVSYFGDVNPGRTSSALYLISLILFFVSYLVGYHFWTPGTIISAAGALIFRYLSSSGMAFNALSGWEIFDPVIFASSGWIPSLGDLMLHVVAIGLTLYPFKLFIRKLRFRQNAWQDLWHFLAIALSLFMADMIRSLIGSLVLNSNISFDVTNISSWSIYSGVACIMVFAIFWLYFLLLGILFPEKANRPSWVIALLALIAFVLFMRIDANRSFLGLLPSVCFAFIGIWLRTTNFNSGSLSRQLAYLGLFSLFFSESVFNHQMRRETEFLDLYAAKLISSKDLEAEYLFRSIENKLAEEFLRPEEFASVARRKEVFEKRIRRLYFSGYLDRYNLLVMTFDSSGSNLNSSTQYEFELLNQLYNFQAFPTLSNHFYQVKSPEIFNGYLAKFENCDINGHYGNVFILLEPKFIQSSYEYPQLTQKKKESKIINIDNYSYAVYNENRLMHQKGSFSYDLIYDSASFAKAGGQISRFSHYISRQEDGSIVVLSHPDTHFLAAVSTFSFSVVLFSILLILLGVSWWGFSYLKEQYLRRFKTMEEYQTYRYGRLQNLEGFGVEQVLLSTRIRVSMMLLVLVGLLISVYMTIQFIRVNDTSRSDKELMYKIREVANQMQNEVDLAGKLKNREARQLIVNEIGDVFKVEASLYNPQGKLLASSVEDLFTLGIQAPLMDRTALRKMRNQKSSQHLQTEKIRNVQYTAAYIPLFSNDRRVIAYLNLPYFSKQNELDQEISSYTVTFVNLYLFLMVVAFIMAYVVSQRISKPLQIIRDKMSITGYGTSNELIEWKQNDEIGRLVQQYNKMVMQLEESAEKLSASEREGAWKEMARQVAHEIKNPLTPMKLNIQHLQRAWSDNSEKLDETFERVTAVLIEQIEGLSHLAGEFSNFANLPVDNVEPCKIKEILLNNIHLFEKTDHVLFQYNSNMPDVMVEADKNQLNRVFGNVIKNAIQAIPENKKGRIIIHLEVNDDEVEIRITDNGRGIPPEDQARIFVPNFSTKTSGMGLGLAMTRKMMEVAGGSIRFKTEVGKETTFILTWPRLKQV